MLMSIFDGGLLGLFLLGFLTRRVDSRAALIATVTTVAAVAVWLSLSSTWGNHVFCNCAACSGQVLGRSLCKRSIVWNWLWCQLPDRQSQPVRSNEGVDCLETVAPTVGFHRG